MILSPNEMHTRAGDYRKQPTGYRAFFPKPLPPLPSVDLSRCQRILSQADRELGRLDGSIYTLPNPDLFVYMFVRKEAVLSSQIEGTQSSLHDLLAAEAKILSENNPNDVHETINYVSAMKHGLSRLNELPLCVRLICEVHEKLLSGIRGGILSPGEVRSSQNWIGSTGCNLNEATYIPPPPQEAGLALSELEKFLNSPRDMSALIQIGLVHAQFETIHPFLDGNGRIGRLLITLFLYQQEVLQYPVLYLSHFFKQHKDRYYQLLQNIRDKGEWEQWLEFFIEGVIAVCQQAVSVAQQILAQREDHRQQIMQNMGGAAANGFRIHEHMYQRPIFNVKSIETLLGTTYAAANALVGRMAKLDLIDEISGQKRNRVFRYSPYLRLFE